MIPVVLEIITELGFLFVDLIVENAERIAIIDLYLLNTEQAIAIVTTFILIPLAIQKINRYQRFLYDNYSTTSNKSVGWLRNILYVVLAIAFFWTVSFVQILFRADIAAEYTFVIVSIALAFLLFWVGYVVILKYDLFQLVSFDQEDENKNLNSSVKKLSSKIDSYYQDLLNLMESKRPYDDVDLSLADLAKHLDLSSGYLSKIIREKENKNFFEFVNTYRIADVKKKLVDKQYQHYSILGIAYECGFKTKSTFNTVFKKFTGYTPSLYKKKYDQSFSLN